MRGIKTGMKGPEHHKHVAENTSSLVAPPEDYWTKDPVPVNLYSTPGFLAYRAPILSPSRYCLRIVPRATLTHFKRNIPLGICVR